MAKSGETKSHRFLSKLGLLDESKLCFGELIGHAYLAGPILFPSGFMLPISSFRDEMILACSFCDATKNQSVYERFLGCLKNELPT